MGHDMAEDRLIEEEMDQEISGEAGEKNNGFKGHPWNAQKSRSQNTNHGERKPDHEDAGKDFEE